MATTTPRNRRRWLRTAEVAALGFGAALILLHAAARIAAETARAQGVDAFYAASGAPLARLEAEAAARDARLAAPKEPPVDQSSWSAQRVRAFEQARALGGVPSAVLAIPSLKLEVPVYGDTGELNLNRGAGHIEGTAPLGGAGNAGIAAHRDGFFRKLEHVELGADVFLSVGERDLRYRVSSIEIAMPTDVHVLASTPTPSITLVTCYPFYFLGAAPQRYVVRADAVDSQPAELPTASRGERT